MHYLDRYAGEPCSGSDIEHRRRDLDQSWNQGAVHIMFEDHLLKASNPGQIEFGIPCADQPVIRPETVICLIGKLKAALLKKTDHRIDTRLSGRS